MSRMKTGFMSRSLLKISACIILFGITLYGCGQKADSEKPSVKLSYPPTLSAASTPSEVVEVLIQGLDAGDLAALTGLVAVKAESKAIDDIYRQYGKRSKFDPEKTARLAAAGWSATYAFFEAGATYVSEEEIIGETATVYAEGRNATSGKSQTLIIRLLREDGLWKVRAGLHQE